MTALAATELEIGDGAPTTLYRFYAMSGALLYVGITSNPDARFKQHAADKAWWPDVARKTVCQYPSRAEAADAEARAIRDEQPIHNKQFPTPRPAPEAPPITGEQLVIIFNAFFGASAEDVATWNAWMITT